MLHEAESAMQSLKPGEHVLPRYLHSDIHDFVARVCDELCMLYPGACANSGSVLRIFKQHLEQRALKQDKTQTGSPAQGCADVPAST